MKANQKEVKKLYTHKDFFKQMDAILPQEVKVADKVRTEHDLFKNPVFQKVMHEAPSIMLIFNFSTMVYEYCSPNIKNIMGYFAEDTIGLTGAEFALNVFEAQHLSILIDLNSTVAMKYYQEYAVLKKTQDIRLSYTCKLKKSDGSYIWALLQTMVLEVLDNGFPLKTICYLTDITDIKTDDKITFNVAVKSDSAHGYETLYVINYDEKESALLSRRELEVLNQLSRGLKNEQIAQKLSISKDTVKTHRKNILKKTGKSNFIELLA